MIEENFQEDIKNIGQIPIITQLLDVICQTTGMGFAAVARVTEDRWITCSVRDDISFGLKPGDELEIKTTICNEIRENHKPVVIDHVSKDPLFYNHHTPLQYGFESYISMPIIRKDGSFFGTLCAIDPNPHNVSSPQVTGMFTLFADLISFHLGAVESVNMSKTELEDERAINHNLENMVKQRTQELEESNIVLEKMNKELQAFAYISSHDLQEPLRKIQTFAAVISDKEAKNLSETGKDYFRRMQNAASRMQTLINDLLAYSRTSITERVYEDTHLNDVLTNVKADLSEELIQKNAAIDADEMCRVEVIPFQFRQLLYNIISNSLKFSDPDRHPVITIRCKIELGSILNYEKLNPAQKYCHIRITDNGIGFDTKYSDRIFELFQRLQDRSQFKGTGIGLAIVKKIVENHHGYITAHGVPNHGAQFDIYLPSK
ncbi:GAF domain-containing protein [Flavobacterium zepuense]|uniref:histidine kinase n=1 Tax=Flavobacterium zepuense TaxID=2593302 RepID=A0A552V1Q3_9FLAO|nr:ATP-binding protein [Flavobacterium zepuense]TRW24378.1 GAF domain-containing protein [Flavobacterium zepuense]